MALGASLVLVAPAGAALKLVTNQNAFPQVNGSSLIWEAEGQNTTDGTGAYVWTVPPAAPRPPASCSGPAVPNEGVVGTDPSKTTPGQQPDGYAATTSFVYFQRQVSVFKSQQAGKNSPNTYVDFYPSATTTTPAARAGR